MDKYSYQGQLEHGMKEKSRLIELDIEISDTDTIKTNLRLILNTTKRC